jgi:predicted transcriptional regulator of viral defense system
MESGVETMVAIKIYLTIVNAHISRKKSSFTIEEILDMVGCSKPTMHRYLSCLIELCLITRVKRGVYAVSSYSLSYDIRDIHMLYDKPYRPE